MTQMEDGTAGHDDATKAALVASLESQRAHVLDVVTGLSNDELRAPKLPSGWSLLGLVRHLSLDVEHYWFRCIVGGRSLESFNGGNDGHTGSWKVPPEESAFDVVTRYRTEIAAANKVIFAKDLDAAPAQRDAWWGTWEVPDLRFVLLHVIAETACHAGHADATRELIDGHQHVVL